MTEQKLNLMDGGMADSNIFVHLPKFDEIIYDGYLEGKVRKFRAVREDLPCNILVLNIIRQDEEIIWKAFEDLIKRSVDDAAAVTQGIYIFDVLTKNIHNEVKTYMASEVTTVITNHARKCAIGEKRLIKYSSIYGILHKLNISHWGKITLKTAVEVFKDEDTYLDLMLKKVIKNFEFAHDPGLLMVNDLSRKPIFNAEDSMQQKRLSVLMAKQIPTSIEYPPEVYIQDANGIRELYSELHV